MSARSRTLGTDGTCRFTPTSWSILILTGRHPTQTATLPSARPDGEPFRAATHEARRRGGAPAAPPSRWQCSLYGRLALGSHARALARTCFAVA